MKRRSQKKNQKSEMMNDEVMMIHFGVSVDTTKPKCMGLYLIFLFELL